MILGTRFRGGLVDVVLNTPLTKVVWRIEDAHGGDTPPDHPCCTATAFTDGHCAWVLHSSPKSSLQNRDPSGFGESRYISIMEYADVVWCFNACHANFVRSDYCQDGTLWRKRTKLMIGSLNHTSDNVILCTGRKAKFLGNHRMD